MSTHTLLVTYATEPDQRQTIAAALPDTVEAVHLADVEPDHRPSAVADADALLTWAPEEELPATAFDALHDGQLIQTVTAGVDHLPLDRIPPDVTVLSNAGAYAESMAEHAVAMYLALSKRLLEEHRKLEADEFDQFRPTRRVSGSTVAVVGFGSVGEAIAELLHPLDVSILAINRRGESTVETAFLGTPDDLEAVLRRCDGVVLAAPLTPETRGLIDREALSWLADDAILINVARGELIDQGDLYAHLRANPDFRAGLEAWWTEPVRHGAFELEYPLLDLPNVLGCPHNSAQVPGIREHGLRQAVRNVAAALVDGTGANAVDRELGY